MILISEKYNKIFQGGLLIIFIILLFLSFNHYFEFSKNLFDPSISKIINYKNYFVVLKGMNSPAVAMAVILTLFFGILVPLILKKPKGWLSGFGLTRVGYVFGVMVIGFLVINRFLDFSLYHQFNEWGIWLFWEKFLYLGIAVLIFLNAFFIGFYLLSQLIFRRQQEKLTNYSIAGLIFVSIVMGLGILGSITLLLGFLHLFNFWFFAFFHLIIAILAVLWLNKNYKKYAPRRLFPWFQDKKEKNIFKFFEYFVLILFVFFISIILIDRFNYIGGSDAQTQHLTYVRKMVEAERYYPLINERTGGLFQMSSSQPQMAILLYINGVLLGNYYVAGVMQVFIAVLVCLGVYLLAYRIFDRRIALGAILIYLGNFFFWRHNILEVDDYLLNVLLVLGAAYLIFLFYTTKNKKWLIPVGLALGFIMSVKFHGIIEALFLGAVAVGIIIYFSRKDNVSPLKPLLCLLIPAILIPAPWFIKNWVVFGNPIYPYAVNILGGKELGLWYETYWHHVLQYSLQYTAIKPTDTVFLYPVLRSFFKNLIAHWYQTGVPLWFTFSPLYLPAIIIGFLKRNRFVWLALGYFWFFYILAAWSGSSPKYMILILSLITPAIAYIIFSLNKSRIYQAVIGIILVLLFIHSSFLGLGYLKLEKTWYMVNPPEHPLFQGLDANDLVIANGHMRYQRTDINVPIVSTATEVDFAVENWQDFYCFWKSKGATHYVMQPKSKRDQEDPAWSAYIPLMEQFGDPNIIYVKRASETSQNNLKQRDAYLSQFADLNQDNGLFLIELPKELPDFCFKQEEN